MHRFMLAAALVVAAVSPLRAQQAFQVRSIRDGGPVVSVTRTVGDWVGVPGFGLETHGAGVEYRALSLHGSFGRVSRAGDRFDVATGAAEVAIGFGALPLMLTLGGTVARANVADGVTITRVAAPVHLASSAVLEFDRVWLHPVLAGGFVVSRTRGTASDDDVEASGAAGLELGTGPISVRATLHHELTARQHANIALRLRLR